MLLVFSVSQDVANHKTSHNLPVHSTLWYSGNNPKSGETPDASAAVCLPHAHFGEDI